MNCRVCGREIIFQKRNDGVRRARAIHFNEIASMDWDNYVPTPGTQRKLRLRLEASHPERSVPPYTESAEQPVASNVASEDNAQAQNGAVAITSTPIGIDGQHETRLLTREQEARLREASSGRQPYDSLATQAEIGGSEEAPVPDVEEVEYDDDWFDDDEDINSNN
jgi:hypothetical protein